MTVQEKLIKNKLGLLELATFWGGVFISPAGVRSVWLRHDLERFEKRPKALEAHVAKTSAVLNENPVD